MAEKIEKSDAEWREQLTPEQYDVLRRRGTGTVLHRAVLEREEAGRLPMRRLRRGAVRLRDEIRLGHRLAELTRPAAEGRVDEHDDRSHGMVRTEVACAMRRSSRARLPRRSAADRPAIPDQFRRPPVRGQVQVACRRADRGTGRSPSDPCALKGRPRSPGTDAHRVPSDHRREAWRVPRCPRAPDTTLPRLLVHPYQVPVAPFSAMPIDPQGPWPRPDTLPSRSIFPNSPSKKICTTRLYSWPSPCTCVKVLFLDSHGRTRLHGRWASSTDIRPYWPVPREEA